MAQHVHLRRTARSALAVAVLLATAVGVTAGPAAAATSGSLLLDDAFTGTSVDNPQIRALNDACLTAATTAPPAGVSNLGRCAKRAGSPAATVTPGFLQLTDASGTATGGVVANTPLPADGGVVVTFDQYQYGGSGADGIGFFLTDGSVALATTGAPGGSLGYAQRDGVPGVVGGYLGVGLDAYGNFSNDSESRGTGCGPGSPWGPTAPSGASSTRSPDSVVLRGPGSGLAGYCYLAGRTASTSLRSSTTPTTQAGIEALARTVQITVSESTLPLVTVAIDYDGRSGPQPLVDVISYQMTTPAPQTYQFGFLGSTGGSTDVHLVRNLRVTSAVPLADLQLTKQVDRRTAQPASYPVGASVPFQYLVTNTRDVPMSAVAVTDPAGAVSCPRTTLGVAGSASARMVCTGAHTLVPADFDGSATYGTTAGATAVVDGVPLASNTSSVTVPLDPSSALTATVTADLPGGATVATAGMTVSYLYTVRNSGNTPLSGLALATARGSAPYCPGAALAVGGRIACSATYRVAQADVDAGVLANAVIATATGPAALGSVPVTSPEATVSTPVAAAAPALTVVSAAATVAGGGVVADTGDAITYAFELRNVGNVTLTAVDLDVTGAVAAGCAATTLAPLASTTCTAGRDVTAADVRAGGPLVATGTGHGTPPAATGSAPVSTPGTDATMPLAVAAPALGLSGLADLADTDADGRADPGELVTYRWTVSNAGNVDLPAPTLTAPGATSIDCGPAAALPVGATRVCTGQHLVTQADVDEGPAVVNRGVAAAGTGAARVQSPAVTLEVLLPAAVTGLHVAPLPELVDLDADGRADVGELVRAGYTVTNTGTRTLTAVEVRDPAADTAVSCPSGPLAPAEQRTCTATHVVTQADVDAGRVRLEATATALAPDGTAVTSAPVVVDLAAAEPVARVGLALQASIRSGRPAAALGDVVDYAFTIGNEGNVTLHAVQLTVTGVVTSARCAADQLAPGRTTACTADRPVTQADVDAQLELAVQGVATGQPPVPSAPPVLLASFARARVLPAALPTTVTSAQVTAVRPVVPADPRAELTTAEATFPDDDGDGRALVGEQVSYLFTVRNSGNTTLRDVAVAVTGFPQPLACTPATLLPGETATCTATRAVTAEDLARGGSLAVDAQPLASAPAGLLGVVGGRVDTGLADPPTAVPIPAVPTPAGPVQPVTPQPAGQPAGLASTGTAPALPVLLGLLLAGAGGVLLLVTTRRRTPAE